MLGLKTKDYLGSKFQQFACFHLAALLTSGSTLSLFLFVFLRERERE